MIDIVYMLVGIVYGFLGGFARYYHRTKTFLLFLMIALVGLGLYAASISSGQAVTAGLIAEFDLYNFLGFIVLYYASEWITVGALNEWKPRP
jgi:hypothetical protein